MYILYVYECFACTHVCISHACLVSVELRREHQIPWNCTYRWLWVTMTVLGTESRASARAVRALNL